MRSQVTQFPFILYLMASLKSLFPLYYSYLYKKNAKGRMIVFVPKVNLCEKEQT